MVGPRASTGCDSPTDVLWEWSSAACGTRGACYVFRCSFLRPDPRESKGIQESEGLAMW